MLPGGHRTRIAAIDTYDGELEEAVAPLSVDAAARGRARLARGELIAGAERAAGGHARVRRRRLLARLEPLRAGARYSIKHTTR